MIPKQYHIHILLMLTVLIIIIFPLLAQQPDEENEQAATRAAERFFELVDADRFADGWEMAAAPMKEEIGRQEWVETLQKFRDKAGLVVSREKSKATAHENEDGEYIVLTYETNFEKLKNVEEILTVMLTENGDWRVASYFTD